MSNDYTVHLRRPKAHQLPFIRSKAKRKVIRAGRRGGKTVGIAIPAVEWFLAGKRVLYAAPTQEQVDTFWFEVKRALQEPIDAGVFVKNETLHTIELPGSKQRIKAKTAWNADTLRGDYADLLILDEWQLMNEEAWEVVGAPMLLDNNGDAVFIYTPPSLHSRSVTKAKDPRHAAKLFKKAAEKQKADELAGKVPRWEVFHFTSLDNTTLSKDALDEIIQDMSSLAYRQEILAEDMDEIPGALWTHYLLDHTRKQLTEVPALTRVVIGVDPPGGATECGIVAAGKATIDGVLHGYVLLDKSLKAPPDTWAGEVLKAYTFAGADRVVAEKNYGGDMVQNTVEQAARSRGMTVSYKDVQATRGKAVRAEPIVALFEQGRCHLVGEFPLLEEEMCGWIPGETKESPNRLDACLVAGTMVMAAGGEVPIEDITPGVMVWTREGLRPVLKAGLTNPAAEVVTVKFSNGRSLTGTGNHPIYTQNRGFVCLDSLVWDDIIEVWKENRLNLKAQSIPGYPTVRIKTSGDISMLRAKVAKAYCTGQFGNLITGLSRMVATFIIKTLTRSIITLTTSNVSTPKNTLPSMKRITVSNSSIPVRRTWIKSGLSQRHGTAPRKGWPGTVSMAKMLTRIGNQCQKFVSSVASSMNRWAAGIPIDSAPVLAFQGGMRHTGDITKIEYAPSVVTLSTSRNQRSSKPAPASAPGSCAAVYNLQVEGTPEYYANGILVHNCVWALTELMITGKDPNIRWL